MINAYLKWANALSNRNFICVETYSGLGRSGRDSQGVRHLLPLDVDAAMLGSAVLDALGHSRILTLIEYGDFFSLEKNRLDYKAWIDDLMSRYGYKSKRLLFSDMKSCSIQLSGTILTIEPSRHDKLERWIREKDDGIENVEISTASSSTEEIGEALRLAFSRCL